MLRCSILTTLTFIVKVDILYLVHNYSHDGGGVGMVMMVMMMVVVLKWY
jgi:phytoene dehydrogenase-like protein